MAVFKCKMCGAPLEIESGAKVAKCEYCGTAQTLPRLDDDRRANLYDRANHFRRNNEFDKAMGIYEQILAEDRTDAEAYWSLVLCRYGIEYVEDPATHKRMPTVNRAQFTAIYDDDNYKSALEYADMAQRELYEAEAKTINEIQKGILAISQKEEPFDVFICYKETDNGGRRTPDSVLAQELYYQLTGEGFKVFFSRITLEDKLGSAYEPYIFAALHSSKVMVALGTRPEHFNAVWVKNEWSRYLALIKNGEKKMLIPAYKDMDPYDLPEEFSHLQAQDMSKLGFMQDLVRGIKKIVDADAPKATTAVKETVAAGGTNVAALLKRAFMFLEDGKWQEADEYCERVLDADPENAQAYLGKLMAELRARTQEKLADCTGPFDLNDNYMKVRRFGDEKTVNELQGYIQHINERNEATRLANLYQAACLSMQSAETEMAFMAAAERFAAIPGYKDADELQKTCVTRAEEAKAAAIEKAETESKDKTYRMAVAELQKDSLSSLEHAVSLLDQIPDWKDSYVLKQSCLEKIDTIKEQRERARAERERMAELARVQHEKNVKTAKKVVAITLPILTALIAFLIVLNTVIVPTIQYNKANSLLETGEWEEALKIYSKIEGFKDSNEKRTSAFVNYKNEHIRIGDEFLANGDNINAAINYLKGGDPTAAKYAYDFSKVIGTSWAASAAISKDGTLFYASNRYTLGEKDKLSGIKSIASFDDYDGIVGIDSNGRVISETNYGYFGFEEVATWEDIKQLECKSYQTFALLEDGTIKAAFSDNYAVDYTMTNIVEIGVHGNDLWAIAEDGKFYYSPCKRQDFSNYDLSEFTSVKKIDFINYDYLVGLTTEGKLVCAEDTRSDRIGVFPFEHLENVVDFETVDSWIFALMEDGTVQSGYMRDGYVAYDGSYMYSDGNESISRQYEEDIISEISDWSMIVWLQETEHGIMGKDIYGNSYWQSIDWDVEDGVKIVIDHLELDQLIENTKNIVCVSSYYWSYGDNESKHAIALCEDGTLYSLNTGRYLTLEENSYGDYYAKTNYNGTYDKVDGWKLW